MNLIFSLNVCGKPWYEKIGIKKFEPGDGVPRVLLRPRMVTLGDWLKGERK